MYAIPEYITVGILACIGWLFGHNTRISCVRNTVIIGVANDFIEFDIDIYDLQGNIDGCSIELTNLYPITNPSGPPETQIRSEI